MKPGSKNAGQGQGQGAAKGSGTQGDAVRILVNDAREWCLLIRP
jgi:hypothetical protein